MLVLSKIAITGGMYSGKTTACRILESLGAYLLYSDNITHHILDYNSSCQARLCTLFGNDIIVEGKCERSKLAEIVFSSPKKLEALEKIVHPLLLATIEKEYERVKQDQNYTSFCVEIPLVQELSWEKHFDKIIAITTDENILFERMKNRTSQEDFNKCVADYTRRMHRQYSPLTKANRADININNNGTVTELKTALLKHLTF